MTSPPAVRPDAPRGVITEFLTGILMLFRGFGLWRAYPGLMLLGLAPALLTAALLVAAITPFAFSSGTVATTLTPFAEQWSEPWRGILRITLAVALVVALLILAASLFTAITLLIGDPFYERIWRQVERDLGGEPAQGARLRTALKEAVRLVLLSLLASVTVAVIALLPVVGAFTAAALGIYLTARLLARELLTRAFDARGLGSAERSALIAARRARVIGFGVATQLCFLVPLGAIAAMPAAVAGATMLARSLLDERAHLSPPGNADA